MLRHPKNSRGLTLTETMVVMMLLSLLTSATIVLLSSVGERSRRNQRERDNLDQLRQTICELRRELGNSAGASVACSANQVVFPGAVLDQVQPLAVDADGDFVCRRWVCYALDTTNGNLWRSELPGSQTDVAGTVPALALFTQRQVVAQNIISFSCSPTATSKLFSMTLKVGQSDNFYILNSQVGTRN
jgi:prepilin-type N-terminal cleavage/methylation domain-containing protein